MCSWLMFDCMCVCLCVCACAESFQLVAVHLPQSGDQLVKAPELSAVISDVSSNPGAIVFGRGVRTPPTRAVE